VKTDGRLRRHQRSASLETILAEINDTVAAAPPAPEEAQRLRYPPVFIVGCARSGSTLLLQWLAASDQFAYPSNLASRFYRNPRFGALLHRALLDLDSREEIVPNAQREVAFDSDLGKTRGAVQPHEFWYFWRRFVRFGDTQVLSPEALRAVDHRTLVHELAGFEEVFDRPLAMKALNLTWHADALASWFGPCVIIHLERDVIDNALSLLSARRDFYDDESVWYSFSPPERADLSMLSPHEQVVGQVLASQRAATAALSSLPEGKAMKIHYERLCEQPAEVWADLREKLDSAGYDIGPYRGPPSFPRRRQPAEQRAPLEPILRRMDPS